MHHKLEGTIGLIAVYIGFYPKHEGGKIQIHYLRL